MALLVGKTMNLVFDRRAVTRTDAFDLTGSGIHRRTVEVRRDDFVSSCVGVGYPATDLPGMLLFGPHERHHRNRRIACLLGHHGKSTDRASIRGGVPVFRRPTRSGNSTKTLSQRNRWRITRATAGEILQTDVDKSAEEGTMWSKPPNRRGNAGHIWVTTPRTLFLLDDQVISCLLKYPQVRLVFQDFAVRPPCTEPGPPEHGLHVRLGLCGYSTRETGCRLYR